MAEQLLEEQRENWGTRAGFVLAAIGSAVGLGNLWGFPYKVHANGGGAFLIPYLLAMLLIGIPLLILEFSLGHMTQRAAPEAYRGINRKIEPIGWWGIILGFVIVTYYPVILAWCGSYLVECVKGIFAGGDLPWSGRGMEGVKKASDFFYRNYLNQWTRQELQGGAKAWHFGGLIGPITVSLAVIWILMHLCIFRGVRMVGKVVLWTVPLPWIMLLILTVRGLTLEGAAQGLNFYLDPDWRMLANPETWRWAFGQMFFSMSLAFGVMVTYASFLHRKSDINNNATIIGLADVGTSFVAGIAVFATLGAMAFATAQAGHPVLVAEGAKIGPGLTFVTFPYALAQLPGSAWFGAVFFIALLTLGIDSAFSITESVLASLVDKTGWNRSKTLIGMTLVGFALGLVYCTRGGMDWLFTMDDFINSTWGGIALLGLLECIVVGWAYRIGRLREHANERSDWKLGVWWDWTIRYVAPGLISIVFSWSILKKMTGGDFLHDADGDLLVPQLCGLILAGIAPALAIALSIIRSGGADAHAQHVGQPRLGRAAGVLGTLLVLAALAIIYCACRLIATHPGTGLQGLMVLGGALPARCLAPAAAAVALLAVVVGAIVVHKAEMSQRRPSGFARFSAGMGVMTFGSALGIMLHAFLLANPLSTPEAHETVSEELTPGSYISLSVMTGILVVGLGWCLLRAMRAAGAAAQEQAPEGIGED